MPCSGYSAFHEVNPNQEEDDVMTLVKLRMRVFQSRSYFCAHHQTLKNEMLVRFLL